MITMTQNIEIGEVQAHTVNVCPFRCSVLPVVYDPSE